MSRGMPTIADLVSDIITSTRNQTIEQAQYVLNSDYSVVWGGILAEPLNNYNKFLEGISVPSKTISTNESRIANTIPAKIAAETTIEDMEVTWRLSGDLGAYRAIEKWMNAAKSVDVYGVVTTGYFDDYCKNQFCQVGISRTVGGTTGIEKTITTIKGLYPTNLQAIQFAAEGGEYLKVVATFACYRIETELNNG